MSGHHGHHRSSHHSRSRMHHSSSSHYSSMQRSRTGSSAAMNDSSGSNSISNHRNSHQDHVRETSSASCDWQEHRSSSGKVYYYNPRTGVSQWEVPLELRQQQTKSHQPSQQQQQQQQQRLASPESELSESSSIRQQENSPSSSASSHHSARSESVNEDKPLLTPSLVYYFKPDLIVDFNSSQREELQNQANQLDREVLLLNEKLLEERVQIKICKSRLEYATTQLEAEEVKLAELRKTIERFGIPNYQ